MTEPDSTGPAPQEQAPGEDAASGKPVSTGVKLLIGCLGLAAVGMIVLAIGVTVGGFALKRTVESALGGLDEHQEASEILQELEAQYPFEPPPDGAVSEDRLVRFLAATDEALEDMGSWAEETATLSDRVSSGEAGGLGQMISGAKTLAGGARARIALAESLENAEMSLGEYVWTGMTMDRAAKAVDRSADPAGIPPANVELVQQYGPSIPRLNQGGSSESSDGEARGSVLAAAMLWGMTELPTWQAMGLDTMGARATN